MDQSPRTNIKKNAIHILEKSLEEIVLTDLYILLKTLGLTTSNVFNFDIAIKNLLKISNLSSNEFFLDIKSAIHNIEAVDQTKPFLHKFSSGGYKHRSGKFLINNERFDLNPKYGLFAGLDPEYVKNLSLVINPQIPTYHPILSFGLFGLVVMNKIHTIEDKPPSHRSLCTNLKKLATNQHWQDAISNLLRNVINQQKRKSVYSLNQFFNDLSHQNDYFENLQSDQKALIKKLIEVNSYINDTLPKEKSSDQLPKNELLPTSGSIEDYKNDIEILSKANEIGTDEDFEQKTNLFIGTIGQRRRTESDAQNLLYSNQTLLTHEINLVEESIHQAITKSDEQDSETLIKVQLCRAMMLYYAIPIEHISHILIGTPELDYTKEEMRGRIVIDPEDNLIFLPTPIQTLHQESDHEFKHPHLPLPLEQTIKEYLTQALTKNPLSNNFRNLINQDVIAKSKSFKKLPGFRQYRITAGKVSRTLAQHVLHITHDEVKAAYLQGGSYDFIHMGCYYTKLSIKNLIAIYQQICSSIFKRCKFTDTHNIKGSLGSNRKPSIENVRRFLTSKQKQIEVLKASLKTNDQLWKFHNEFTLYTITLLNLSTAHRPHSDPYYSSLSFIEDDFVQITEKVIMKGFEGRLAILHDSSRKQYAAYLKHLQNTATRAKSSGQTQLHEMLLSLTTGEQNPKNGVPLFFLIKEGKLKRITKHDQSAYYLSDPETALAENFYRHLLSSELANLNTPRILIATQMGHISKGLEPYSKTSSLSPLSFKEQLTPYLDQYFNLINPGIIKAPHLAKYRCIEIQSFSWKPFVLGPYKREQNRLYELDTQTIQVIDQHLKENGVNTNKHKMYLTQKVQSSHLKLIKKLGFKRPQRTLVEYYLHKNITQKWKVEKAPSLIKSLLNPTFGINFQIGKQYFEQIHQFILSYLDEEFTLTDIEHQALIGLSAVINGSVFHTRHLIEISNKHSDSYKDILVSMAINLKDKNGNVRTWILNSLSVALVKKSKNQNRTVTQKDFDQFIRKHFQSTRLPSLIRRIQAYLLLITPSYIANYVADHTLQNSIGAEGYQALFGNYTIQNATKRQSELSTNKTTWIKETLKPSSQKPRFKAGTHLSDLASLLSQEKKKHTGYTKTLEKVLNWESATIKEHSLNFIEATLVDWVKHNLNLKKIKVSSITTYYSKSYNFIAEYFYTIDSPDDLDIEILKLDIYPEIIRSIRDAKNNDDTKLPFSSLASFHSFLAGKYGLEQLHFSKEKFIQTVPSIQSTILESEYEACLKAIDKTPECDNETKTSLKIGLILYKRCGLRRIEVFKLKPKHICTISKTVHISGDSQRAEKSKSGNRIISYNALLTTKESQLLERWTQYTQSISKDTYLLFGKTIQKLSFEVVVSKVERYYTLLLRSITGNANLSIKSLRKSFASDTFLNLTLGCEYKTLLDETCISNINARIQIEPSFNLPKPHGLHWLIANWTGHSTPLTTFEYYCLTLDLSVFAITEKLMENRPGYLTILKSLTSESRPQSFYKNLNRYKGNKYVKFYSNHLSPQTKVAFEPGQGYFSDLFNNKLNNEIIQKILACYLNGWDYEQVDNYLLLTQGTSRQVIETCKRLLQTGRNNNIPATLFQKTVRQLIWWQFNQQFSKKRISKLTEKTLENLSLLKKEELSTLFKTWIKQTYNGEFSINELRLLNIEDLTTFLEFYQKFNAHADCGGYLQIEISGIKNNESLPLFQVDQNDYLLIQDNRIHRLDEFERSSFTLKLSYRDKDTKKPATCHYGLNSALFFAKVLIELK